MDISLWNCGETCSQVRKKPYVSLKSDPRYVYAMRPGWNLKLLLNVECRRAMAILALVLKGLFFWDSISSECNTGLRNRIPKSWLKNALSQSEKNSEALKHQIKNIYVNLGHGHNSFSQPSALLLSLSLAFLHYSQIIRKVHPKWNLSFTHLCHSKLMRLIFIFETVA